MAYKNHCCKKYTLLAAKQVQTIVRLQGELNSYIADGNEYHAAAIRQDMLAASSYARLIHKHTRYRKVKTKS